MVTKVVIPHPAPCPEVLFSPSGGFVIGAELESLGVDCLLMQRIRHNLAYDPISGDLRWLVAGRGRRVGGRAGNIMLSRADTSLFYSQIKIHSHRFLAHRLAFLLMTGRWPRGHVDHIDGNGLNNSWRNLEDVSHSVNTRRGKLGRGNRSGISGVCWDRVNRHWRARIGAGGLCKYLGFSKDFFEACCLRKSAENRLEGYNGRGSLK